MNCSFADWSTAVRRLLTFRVLLLALVALFVYRHGLRIELGSKVASVEPVDQADRLRPAKAQLASFSHPASQRPAEVNALRQAYIERFAPVAVAEMNKYGIPASITLAQGLLESVAGTSKLATSTNNHFGIKCFAANCAPGHCRNYDDDHHKDFFRSYETAWESYRAHSEFLAHGRRYAALFELAPDDYKGWAKGLRKAGYATDKAYANKLISLIERYELDRFDE